MRAAVLLWVCAWAYFGCVGWLLSALHALNGGGYAVALTAGLGGILFWRRKLFENEKFFPRWPALRRRFRRPLSAIFFLVAALVVIGGAGHAPTNYDALTYRLPRVLNWLDAGGWHWISTFNLRMNYSTTAWEWTALPQLALLHSDRGLFLINACGFLLLPGLLFSVFRQLGVARRVAWTWMWILPLAYGYVTQAGSIGNDLTGTVFCLAAVNYGMRARQFGRVTDVWLCGLAAALMTANKMSNLPLLLPCLVAVWPALSRLRERWRGTLTIGLVAVLVSAAPTMLFNQLHTGNWNGDPKNEGKMQLHHPIAGLLGNGLLLAQQSLMPPVLPASHQINDSMNRHLPAACVRLLEKNFPRYFQSRFNELPSEEGAALGLGVSLPLLLALAAAIWKFGGNFLRCWSWKIFLSVGCAAWAAFAVYLLKMGSEAGPRLLLPYYPLVIAPLLLLPVQCRLLQFRSWRLLLLLGAFSVLPVLVLAPNRPLWPALSITEKLVRQHPSNTRLQRLASVYATYAHRNDVLAPLRDVLPAEARTIGFVASSNDTDYSLWRPLGTRRIVYLRSGVHSGLQLPADLEWLVVKRTIWPEVSDRSLEDWAANHQAKIVQSVSITTLVSGGAENWCVLHIERH